jgi:hypothetical protein
VVKKEEIVQYAVESATKQGVDPALVLSVIQAESNFNPKAVSKVGARGLMQLMPATAKGLGVKDSFDYRQNIDGGVKYLSSMLKRFDNNPRLAVAAYNAGPGAVQKYGGVPPYKETTNYVNKILGSETGRKQNNNTNKNSFIQQYQKTLGTLSSASKPIQAKSTPITPKEDVISSLGSNFLFGLSGGNLPQPLPSDNPILSTVSMVGGGLTNFLANLAIFKNPYAALATTSALQEFGAQTKEIEEGTRTSLNPARFAGQVATDTATGALPLSVAGGLLKRGVSGAVLGAGGNVAGELAGAALGGENVRDLGPQAGFGAALGTVLGTTLGVKPPNIQGATPSNTSIQQTPFSLPSQPVKGLLPEVSSAERRTVIPEITPEAPKQLEGRQTPLLPGRQIPQLPASQKVKGLLPTRDANTNFIMPEIWRNNLDGKTIDVNTKFVDEILTNENKATLEQIKQETSPTTKELDKNLQNFSQSIRETFDPTKVEQVQVDDETVLLKSKLGITNEQIDEINLLETQKQLEINKINKQLNNKEIDTPRSRALKAAANRKANQLTREVVQGDSLDFIPEVNGIGGLTKDQLKTKITELRKDYTGKPVLFDGKFHRILSSKFGRYVLQDVDGNTVPLKKGDSFEPILPLQRKASGLKSLDITEYLPFLDDTDQVGLGRNPQNIAPSVDSALQEIASPQEVDVSVLPPKTKAQVKVLEKNLKKLSSKIDEQKQLIDRESVRLKGAAKNSRLRTLNNQLDSLVEEHLNLQRKRDGLAGSDVKPREIDTEVKSAVQEDLSNKGFTPWVDVPVGRGLFELDETSVGNFLEFDKPSTTSVLGKEVGLPDRQNLVESILNNIDNTVRVGYVANAKGSGTSIFRDGQPFIDFKPKRLLRNKNGDLVAEGINTENEITRLLLNSFDRTSKPSGMLTIPERIDIEISDFYNPKPKSKKLKTQEVEETLKPFRELAELYGADSEVSKSLNRIITSNKPIKDIVDLINQVKVLDETTLDNIAREIGC